VGNVSYGYMVRHGDRFSLTRLAVSANVSANKIIQHGL
jgi:hypothetical protein